MKPLEVPATDSGYPTPRDDIPLSSRSVSPSSSPEENHVQMTSTPIRGNRSRSMKECFSGFRQDLSIIESAGSDSVSPENNSNSLVIVKTVLSMSKELKESKRTNTSLHEENETLRYENESLRDENFSLREESRQFEAENPEQKKQGNLCIPKLQFHDDKNSETVSLQEMKLSEQIKKELLSFIRNEEDRTVVEAEMKNMLISNPKQPTKVFTATATIEVDTGKIDADVQTESEDAVNVINANLKLEVDQLNSQKEVIEKKNNDLENRLFNYQQLKEKFEQDEKKLRLDLENKLKSSQDKLTQSEKRVNELQLRLNKKKKELEEVGAENKRLLEDKSTHDFEVDELKVHGEDIEKQKKDVEEELDRIKKNVKDLERALIEEKKSKTQLESDLDNTKKEHESLIDKLNRKAEEAIARESAALEKIAVVEAENKEYVKESKYLTESRQVLLDSENTLKNEVNVLISKLRQKDSQLSVFKEQISERERHREILESQLASLETMNKELNKEKYDSNELLDELKKGKLEIDHLRQQLQLKATESEELGRLKEDLEQYASRETRLKEKLEQAIKKEAETEVKHEELIRSEASAITQLNRLKAENIEQKETIDSIQQQVVLKDIVVLNLEKSLEGLHNEFEEFKTNANLQYDTEIFERNQQIEALRGRLIELETYPGQTVSVSRKNAEAQTEEIQKEAEAPALVSVVEEHAFSPEVSLVSEEFVENDFVQLEEKLRGIILEMNKIVSQQRVDDISAGSTISPAQIASEVLRKISQVLDKAMHESESNTEKYADEVDHLWNDLNRDIQRLVNFMKEKLEKVEQESIKNVQISQRRWKENERLRKEFNELKDLAEQRLIVAEQFKEEYDIESREKEDAVQANMRLQELHNEEISLSQQVEKDLRERLEGAEHDIQRMIREKIQLNEEHEAEIDTVRSKLSSNQADHERVVANLKADVEKEKEKRVYDKSTMDILIGSCKAYQTQNEYLKKRNKDRHRLVNHMNAVIMKFRDLGIGNTDSRQEIIELTDQVKQSGLLNEDEKETAIINKTERRILGVKQK